MSIVATINDNQVAARFTGSVNIDADTVSMLADFASTASGKGAALVGTRYGHTADAYLGGRVNIQSLGFSETNSGAANAAILRAALDAGPCTCGPGEFPLEGFLWRDFDDFEGSGYGTYFYSNAGIAMKFGCMAGDSFTIGGNGVDGDNCSPHYAFTAPARGDRTITLTTLADAANFVGETHMWLWSDTGYTDGGGEFKPSFQQGVGIVSVDTGTGVITLEDAIYRTAPGGATMYASPGSTVNGREQGTDRGTTYKVRAVGFRVANLSGTESWSRFGGTYKSEIDIWVGQTQGGFSLNGIAHSNVRLREVAGFTTFLCEVPLFSHDSTIRIDKWSELDGADHGGHALFGTAEGAHDCTIDIGPGYAKSTTGGAGYRYAAVQLARGGGHTVILRNGVRVAKCQAGVLAERVTGDNMDYRLSTVRIEGTLALDVCHHPIQQNAGSAGVYLPFHVTGGRVYAPGADTSQAYVIGTGLVVDCEIDAAAQPLTGSAGTDEADFSRARFVTAPSSIGTGKLKLPAQLGAGKSIDWLEDSVPNGAAITSTSFVFRYDKTVAAGTLKAGDMIPFSFIGRCTGTASTKSVQIKLTVNGTSYAAQVDMPAAFASWFQGSGFLYVVNSTALSLSITVNGNGLTAQLVGGLEPTVSSIDTNDVQIQIGAKVATGTDSIIPRGITVHRPTRKRG